MLTVKRGGVPLVCLLLVLCATPASAVVTGCNSSALGFLDKGWGRLTNDTMNLTAALAEFNSAISVDPAGCTPAYVARAIVKVAQIYDTPDVASLRRAFGDTNTFDTATTDTKPRHARNYTFVNDGSMDAAKIQGVLGGPVLSILNSALADLELAENAADTGWQMPVPTRFIDGDTRGYAEVDHTDVLFFISAIHAAKAAIHMATAYNANVGQDWRKFNGNDEADVPSGDTFITFVQSNSSFLTLRSGGADSFTTAFGLLGTADTKMLKFFELIEKETNPDVQQDTDLFGYYGFAGQRGRDSGVWDHVDTEGVSEFKTDHNDTVARAISGQTLTVPLKKSNADLGSISVRPKSFFDYPETRAVIPTTTSVLYRGIEFGENFFPDPTFQGLLPGMTNNDIFLLANEADSFIEITSLGTHHDFLYNSAPSVLDVKFNNPGGAGSVGIRWIKLFSGTSNSLSLSFTPQSGVSSHLRIFFKPDLQFTATEKALMRGRVDTTLIYIVPWTATGGHAVDAGLSLTNFQTNYQTSGTNLFVDTWTFPTAQFFDTLVPFRFGSEMDPTQFKPVPSTEVKTGGAGVVVATVPVNRFGYFILAEQAPFIKPVRGFLEGDADTWLEDSFIIKIVNGVGNPVPNVVVTFNVPTTTPDLPSGASSGMFDSAVKTTNSSGEAMALYKLGNKPGVYKITVTTSGAGTAYVFAFTTGYTPHPGGVWRMVSMPVYPSASLPSSLGDTIRLKNPGFGDARFPPDDVSPSDFIGDDFTSYRIYYWDPAQTNSSSDFADAGHNHYIVPSTIMMGSAYWIKTTTSGVLDAVNRTTGTYSELDEDGKPETVVMTLHAGWNMIGTPYSFSIHSDNIHIDTDNDNHALPIDSIPTSVITHQLYWIGPGNTANPGSSGYQQGPGVAHPDVGLFPFAGYWISAAQSCTMVFLPQEGGDTGGAFTEGGAGSAAAPPFILTSAPGLVASATDWTVQLYVQSANGVDYENFAGVRPAGQGAPSYYEPPLAPGGVGLAFVEGGMKYSQHLKTAEENPTWEVEVRSATAGSVTINASNVSSVPGGTPVMLRDETTGQVVDLRSSGYTYTSGAEETRRFTFAASDLKPGYFARIIHPTACLIRRAFGETCVTAAARRIRDMLLGTSNGRMMVEVYYSLSF